MIGWLTAHTPAWNSWMALLLYWLPLALCAYGYTLRTFVRIAKDRADRSAAESERPGGVPPHNFYHPSITIGTIVGYAALAVVPVANLFAAIFDVAPEVFGDFLRWAGKALDIPIVPRR